MIIISLSISKLQVFDFAMKCHLYINTENKKHREDFHFEVYRGAQIPITDCLFLTLSTNKLNNKYERFFFSSLSQKQHSLYAMQK